MALAAGDRLRPRRVTKPIGRRILGSVKALRTMPWSKPTLAANSGRAATPKPAATRDLMVARCSNS